MTMLCSRYKLVENPHKLPAKVLHVALTWRCRALLEILSTSYPHNDSISYEAGQGRARQFEGNHKTPNLLYNPNDAHCTVP